MALELIVPMGRFVFAYPGVTLTCLGLGSCVGVLVYDTEMKIAGMAHVMLPETDVSKEVFSIKTGLLISKEQRVIDLAKIVMKDEGIRFTLNKGRSYIEKYQSVKPDFVFLDANLETSTEITSALIKADSNAFIYLINVDYEKAEFAELYNIGANGLLYSPTRKSKLSQAIKSGLFKKDLKHANLTINCMLDEMVAEGCSKNSMEAKIAGGSHMFTTIQDESIISLGKSNIEAVRKVLRESSIPIKGSSTGGNSGKTIRFDFSDKLHIKTKNERFDI